MTEYLLFREKAIKHLRIADHMLSVTYALVKDTKLLLIVIENIFLAYSNAISALLYFDKKFNDMPRLQEDFDSKFLAFNNYSLPRHNIHKSCINNINDVKSIMLEHKKSPIEFARNEKYVICSDSYKLRTLTINELKGKISKAKVFIQEINNIIDKNEPKL